MASQVILKKSSVAARVPVAGDLAYGELALNYTDGKLYYKTNTDVVAVLNPVSTGTVSSITAGTGLSGGTITGTGTIAIDSTVATLTGSQTLTNKTLTTPTITGLATFTGVYHNSYLTTYGSLFIEGSSTNNIVQVSSHGVTEGVGLWSNGVSGLLYANAGLYFKVGTTLRDQDTPTGGTVALTIGSNTNATFAGTVAATSFSGSGSSLTGVQPTLVSGTNIKTINGTSVLGSGDITISSGTELQNRYIYTATASQTTFAADYTAPYVDVFYNGVKLINSVDFTATSNTSIVLAAGAIAGDTIDIIAQKVYEVGAAMSTTNLLDWPAALTVNELAYVDGVTSSIQTQLNTKASTGKAIAMAMIFGG